MRGEMPGWQRTAEGIWYPYNPTLGGTGWSGTGATATGFYMIINGTCFWQQTVTLGAASSISTNAIPWASLPFPLVVGQKNTQITVELIDAGSNTYRGLGGFGGNGVNYYGFGANGAYAFLQPTFPFTWSPADGDAFGSSGFYKLAT